MKDAKGHGSNARGTLQRLGIPLGNDYHTLHSSKAQELADEAKKAGYRKPANANGSTGRYFHDYLQRKAGREPISNADAAHSLSSGSKSASAPVHDAMIPPLHGYAPRFQAASDAAGYYARASSGGGRKIGEYGPHPDRETAASHAWGKHPTAKQVSTSRGPHGFDIQWHRKA